jgi:TetR/AcrR family transcriptional repressor of nem operon
MKADAKTGLLRAGARVVHRKGFNDAGLQEILEEAQVPKGSFYFYFKSKEDFGLQLIDYFADFYLNRADEMSSTRGGTYLERLRRYLDWQGDYMEANGHQGGCPFGNLSQEMADRNDRFREKLQDVFSRLRDRIAQTLTAAQEAGEIDPALDPRETADCILSAWQGVLIQMKVAKNGYSRRAFYHMVFDRLLASPTGTQRETDVQPSRLKR